MKYCVFCGKELEDQAMFCGGCGEKCLEATAQQVQPAQKVVYRSDSALAEETTTKTVDHTPKQKQKTKKKKNWFTVILIIVLIVVLLAGVGFYAGLRLLEGWTLPETVKAADTENTEDTTEENRDSEEVAKRLAEAEQLAASGDYTAAMAVVEQTKKDYPDGADYDAIYQEYFQKNNEQIRQTAIEQADEYAKVGDYLSAVTVIDNVMNQVGEDETLRLLYQTYADAYAADILAQAEQYVQNGQYEDAKAVLDTATDIIPEHEGVQNKKEEVAQYKTVLLSALTPINGEVTWNEGSPEDPFGNDYSLVKNYTIAHTHWGGNANYVEFKVSKEYSQLSFSYAPYSDFGENSSSYIQIYVNDVLRYTTPKITRKSGLQTAQIDICDADYIKIVITKSENGCVLITDAVLQSFPNHNCEEKIQISLSAISVLNGGFSWENDYPIDNLGGTYNFANNYSVFHSHWGEKTSYAEYYIAGKYTSFNFAVAPYGDFAEKQNAVVRVYIDDTLSYTATITGKTAKISSETIDLTGADYLKIVVEWTEYGCVILSDAMLTPAEDTQ